MCPDCTSFLGQDMEAQPGQIHVGCGSAAQEHLLSLPPAERRVSGLFEVQWQVYMTPWTTSCLESLGKGQELLPLDLLERFPAGWCRCSQVTAQGFITKNELG